MNFLQVLLKKLSRYNLKGVGTLPKQIIQLDSEAFGFKGLISLCHR